MKSPLFILRENSTLEINYFSGGLPYKFAEPYVQDLGFNNFEEVTNDKLFEKKVSNTIKNQISLAEQIGFDTEWRYK